MDGYIKNKNEAIVSAKQAILYKYAVTFLIVMFIPVWLLALAANQPPEKWIYTEIVFSHISQERIGLQRGRSYVLNTRDGRKFVIASKDIDLIPGGTYSLVFSNTIAGGDHVKALSDENIVFYNLDDSISRWEGEQQEYIVAIIVTLVIEVVALIMIDRLWCKQEYSKIKKLRADIKRREDRTKNK